MIFANNNSDFSLSRRARLLACLFIGHMVIIYPTFLATATASNSIEKPGSMSRVHNGWAPGAGVRLQQLPGAADVFQFPHQGRRKTIVARRRVCKKHRRYRKRCNRRVVRMTRCRTFRKQLVRCHRKPVSRTVCTIKKRRVRRCRGPLGQQECRVITKRYRQCRRKITYVKRCRRIPKTIRRCRATNKVVKRCRRVPYRVRRCRYE